MACHTASDQVAELAAQLRGKVLHIPDLKTAFRGWPTGINQNLDLLRSEVDQMLENVIADEHKLHAIKACDFALLTCSMFPKAEWAQLRHVAARFVVWIFVWDDEIDEGESAVATQEEYAHYYCQSSIDYVRRAMHSDVQDNEQNPERAVGDSLDTPIMTLFRDLCSHLCRDTDHVQRGRTFRELELYITSTEVEQYTRQHGKLPTPKQYFEMRLGTSGIYPALTILDFISGTRLPDWMVESNEVKIIWREATVLCMLTNDIYSFKKELASGSVLNMIPVLFNTRRKSGLDATVQDFMEMLHRSVMSFEKAAARLRVMANGAGLDAEFEAYIDICRTLVTGFNEWALVTKRYKMFSNARKDGKIVVPL